MCASRRICLLGVRMKIHVYRKMESACMRVGGRMSCRALYVYVCMYTYIYIHT
jgi:hypothetical protein